MLSIFHQPNVWKVLIYLDDLKKIIQVIGESYLFRNNQTIQQ
jgi:hypothetical protein